MPLPQFARAVAAVGFSVPAPRTASIARADWLPGREPLALDNRRGGTAGGSVVVLLADKPVLGT